METIIDIQKENVDDLNDILYQFIVNLSKIQDMSNESQNNIIDKIRLLNKKMEILKDNIYDVLDDLMNGGCYMDECLKKKLEEEKQINQNIKKFTPLILYYMMNNEAFS